MNSEHPRPTHRSAASGVNLHNSVAALSSTPQGHPIVHLMKKYTTPFTAQLITYDTSLPFQEVVARFDIEVNKAGSAEFLPRFRTVKTKPEMEALIHASLGGKDFLYFLEMNHDKWMNMFRDETGSQAVVYTLGNPLLAATIMQHDIRAGYNIPPRLMILQKSGGGGTNVIYHLPSSLVDCLDKPDLRAALEVLDDKLDKMVTRITAV